MIYFELKYFILTKHVFILFATRSYFLNLTSQLNIELTFSIPSIKFWLYLRKENV